LGWAAAVSDRSEYREPPLGELQPDAATINAKVQAGIE
jgi:hypothetical protein